MSLRSRARVLIRNAGLNLSTQIGLILIFLVTTPLVVHGLGELEYGILSITLVVVGIFGFLDLGMSHAAVKFVSDHLARDEKQDVRSVASTCLLVNLAFGVAGAVLIALLAPLLVSHLFNIPEALHGDGRMAFYLLALSFPFVLVQNTLKGIASALQRFDLINLVGGIAGALQGLVPMGLVLLGFGLVEVVLAYSLIRVVSCFGYILLLRRILPEMGGGLTWHGDTLRRLLRFSSWLILSALVWPLLVSCDRLLIGSLLTAEAVTYYAVPFGIASRLKVFSTSMAPVLFPAFSERVATSNMAAVRSLFLKSGGLLLCVLAPMVLVLVLISGRLLALWMGEDFARHSTLVLQLLAVGMLMNALGSIPLMALLGLGRTDVIAKVHLLELPVYVGLSLILIPRMGIAGAAAALLVQSALDLVLLTWPAWRLAGAPREAPAQGGVPGPDTGEK